MNRVRYDFGSPIFLNTLIQIGDNGIVTYGKGEGLLIDPGRKASIHLILDHPDSFQFQSSIHKDMKGGDITSDCGGRVICKRERSPRYG